MLTMNRRRVGAGLLALTAAPAFAADGDVFQYRGFTVDMTAAEARKRDAVGASIRQQIDLVESLTLREDIRSGFASCA